METLAVQPQVGDDVAASAGRWVWPGLAVVVNGAVQADAAVVASVYRSSSPASEDLLSFPWEGATAVATSSVWGVTQVLLVVGFVAFARGGVARGRVGRLGAWIAVVGATLFVVAHAVSVVAYDTTIDTPVALAVMALFAVGSLLQAVGLVAAGVATVRGGTWAGWRRWTPLAVGLAMIVLVPVQLTPLLAAGVGLFALAVLAFGAALIIEARPVS